VFDHPIGKTLGRLSKVRSAAVAGGVLAALVLAFTAVPSSGAPVENAAAQRKEPVTASIQPQQLNLTPQPCLPTTLTVTFHNQSGTSAYATSFVEVDDPLRVSRDVITTYVPTEYDVDIPFELTVPQDTPAGTYQLEVTTGHERLTVPITVTRPGPDPNRNLALGQAASASSTHGLFAPCGVADGNHTYTGAGYNQPPTAWVDATSRQLPDQVELLLAEPASIGRIDVQSHAQARFAIRDWDIQLQTADGWVTVAQVRGHTTGGLHTSRFDPVVASAIRVVVLATTGYEYSTIVEIEAYGQ
jgi:hypothetical protein